MHRGQFPPQEFAPLVNLPTPLEFRWRFYILAAAQSGSCGVRLAGYALDPAIGVEKPLPTFSLAPNLLWRLRHLRESPGTHIHEQSCCV
jgi:hypothetical protein